MGRRLYRNPAGRAATERSILAQARHRALAAAEVHRDRARAGILRLEAQLAEKEGLGLSIESELAHLARLRVALVGAEGDITAARRTLGLDQAA